MGKKKNKSGNGFGGGNGKRGDGPVPVMKLEESVVKGLWYEKIAMSLREPEVLLSCFTSLETYLSNGNVSENEVNELYRQGASAVWKDHHKSPIPIGDVNTSFDPVAADVLHTFVLALTQWKKTGSVDVLGDTDLLPQAYYDTLAAMVAMRVVDWDGGDAKNFSTSTASTTTSTTTGSSSTTTTTTTSTSSTPGIITPGGAAAAAASAGEAGIGIRWNFNGPLGAGAVVHDSALCTRITCASDSADFADNRYVRTYGYSNGCVRDLTLVNNQLTSDERVSGIVPAPIVGAAWMTFHDATHTHLVTVDSRGMITEWCQSPSYFQLKSRVAGDRVVATTRLAGGTLVVAWASGLLTSIDNLKQAATAKQFGGQGGYVHAIGAAAYWRFVTGSEDGSVRVWWGVRRATAPVGLGPRRGTKALQEEHPGHGKELEVRCVSAGCTAVRSLLPGDEGLVFAGYQDGVIRGWDIWECCHMHGVDHVEKFTSPVHVLKGFHVGAVTELVQTDNALVSAGEDHTIRLWDLDRATCISTFVLPAIPSVMHLQLSGVEEQRVASQKTEKASWERDDPVLELGMPGGTVMLLKMGPGGRKLQPVDAAFQYPLDWFLGPSHSLSDATTIAQEWRAANPSDRGDWDRWASRAVELADKVNSDVHKIRGMTWRDTQRVDTGPHYVIRRASASGLVKGSSGGSKPSPSSSSSSEGKHNMKKSKQEAKKPTFGAGKSHHVF